MSLVIISSLDDFASTNIKENLIKKSKWKSFSKFYNEKVLQNSKFNDVYLLTIPEKKIYHENIDKEISEKLNIEPKQAIFISKHTSKMKKPSLTVHPLGNFADAKFGGKKRTLVESSPKMMTHLLRLIKYNLDKTSLNFDVCYEVTHHGPHLKIPTFFVEIGSTEEEWKNKEAGTIISNSILELIKNYRYESDFPNKIPVLIGIGGGHYAPRFTDIIFEKKAAFGHMIPSYHINDGNIDKDSILSAINKTPNLNGVYLHKKYLKKSQVTEFKKILEKIKTPIISSKDLIDL